MSPMFLGDDERAQLLARMTFWRGFGYGWAGASFVVGLFWWWSS